MRRPATAPGMECSATGHSPTIDSEGVRGGDSAHRGGYWGDTGVAMRPSRRLLAIGVLSAVCLLGGCPTFLRGLTSSADAAAFSLSSSRPPVTVVGAVN